MASRRRQAVDHRGQLIILTVAILAVGMLAIAVAYAQVSAAVTEAPAATDPAPGDVTVALELVAQEALATDARDWGDRHRLAESVGMTFDARIDRVERAASTRTVTYAIARQPGAAGVASAVCEDYPVACTTIDGVVLRRYGDTAVAVGIVVKIEATRPTGSTQGTYVLAPPP